MNAAEWNERYVVGTPVVVFNVGVYFESRTLNEAREDAIGGYVNCISPGGRRGDYRLSDLSPMCSLEVVRKLDEKGDVSSYHESARVIALWLEEFCGVKHGSDAKGPENSGRCVPI